MNLEDRIVHAVSAKTEMLTPPLFDVDEIRRMGRRQARRRAGLTVVAASVLVGAVAWGVTPLVGSSEHSAPPVDTPLPTVDPVNEPAGQTAIEADFGPQDVVHGMEEFGSATSEPGATELHANLPYPGTPYASIAGYCRGSEDLWWVIGGHGGTYGQCSPDAEPAAAPALDFQPVGNAPVPVPGPDEFADQDTSVDMFLTGPLTAKTRNCIETEYMLDAFYSDCLGSNPDVTLVKNADATFGFTGYVHSAPLVVDDPLGDRFEALANIAGTEYLFTHGVVSAPGAARLATYLEPSEQPRLVLLLLRHHRDDQQLLVDGEPASFPTDFFPGSAWYTLRQEYSARALVPPGSHNVTFDIPGDAQAVLLVYEAQTPE